MSFVILRMVLLTTLLFTMLSRNVLCNPFERSKRQSIVAAVQCHCKNGQCEPVTRNLLQVPHREHTDDTVKREFVLASCLGENCCMDNGNIGKQLV